jgi:hypothetical protein
MTPTDAHERAFSIVPVLYIAAALGCCVTCVMILARGW